MVLKCMGPVPCSFNPAIEDHYEAIESRPAAAVYCGPLSAGYAKILNFDVWRLRRRDALYIGSCSKLRGSVVPLPQRDGIYITGAISSVTAKSHISRTLKGPGDETSLVSTEPSCHPSAHFLPKFPRSIGIFAQWKGFGRRSSGARPRTGFVLTPPPPFRTSRSRTRLRLSRPQLG